MPSLRLVENDMQPNSSVLACPVCQLPIAIQSKTLRCTNHHSFDQAKQGYWNLLIVQQKKSKDPGDNPAMVQARRDFLELAHYAPLANAVAVKLQQALERTPQANVLDMGCGEGYYTAQWVKTLAQHHFIGLDISKHAVKAATKRTQEATWLVATGAKMPIIDNSLDAITVVFSRLMPLPFARVLKDNGLLIFVWPGDKHLVQLKEVLYDALKTSQFDPVAELEPLFSLVSKETLTFDFKLEDKQHLLTLLEMTPHGQRINQQKKQELFTQLPFTLTFSVNIGCFKKP